MEGQGGGAGRFAGMGALGCLGLFTLLAILALALGGSVYIDGGGLILLLIIGAVIGLFAYAFYNKGRRDAGGPLRGGSSRPGTSVDDLMAQAERDFAEGRITQEELERRRRRAWGHPD